MSSKVFNIKLKQTPTRTIFKRPPYWIVWIDPSIRLMIQMSFTDPRSKRVFEEIGKKLQLYLSTLNNWILPLNEDT